MWLLQFPYAVMIGVFIGFTALIPIAGAYIGAVVGAVMILTVSPMQALQFLADRGATGYLVGNSYIVTVLQGQTLRFPAGCSGILSVFCMGADAEGVCIRGLQYSLEDGTLTAGFPLGVSNHFTGELAEISVRQGSLLVLWDRANGFPERIM